MATLSLEQFKRQASFFLREKLKTARLALTDVTQIELSAEEATSDDPWGPDTKTMSSISNAAFIADDYWRICRILHCRLDDLDKKHWRGTFKTLLLLEYLLTHGPESFGEEFKTEKGMLQRLTTFEYKDDLGFDRGEGIRKKAMRILDLLSHDGLLKQERQNARRISRSIRGFGSFSSNADDLRRSSLGSNDMEKGPDKLFEKPIEIAEVRYENQDNDQKNYSKSFTFPGSISSIKTRDKTDALDCKTDKTELQINNEWCAFQDTVPAEIDTLTSNACQNRKVSMGSNSRYALSHSFMEHDQNLVEESLLGTSDFCHADRSSFSFEDHEPHPFNYTNEDSKQCFLSNSLK